MLAAGGSWGLERIDYEDEDEDEDGYGFYKANGRQPIANSR